jgi:tetratricopeptide (TPR) repeat protein
LLDQDGEMLVRLQDGRVAEPSGQLRFDFMRPGEYIESVSLHDGWTAEDWFRKDLDRPTEAAAAYGMAIELEPTIPCCISIWQMLCMPLVIQSAPSTLSKRPFASIRGTSRPEIGSVLSEVDRNEDAVASYRKALAAMPTYADAHYNLAETLCSMGRDFEARRHWRAFLQYGPPGDWADEATRRMN